MKEKFETEVRIVSSNNVESHWLFFSDH